MPSSGMLRGVAVVGANVSEERITSIARETRIVRSYFTGDTLYLRYSAQPVNAM
jgi:hypothetical protein